MDILATWFMQYIYAFKICLSPICIYLFHVMTNANVYAQIYAWCHRQHSFNNGHLGHMEIKWSMAKCLVYPKAQKQARSSFQNGNYHLQRIA